PTPRRCRARRRTHTSRRSAPRRHWRSRKRYRPWLRPLPAASLIEYPTLCTNRKRNDPPGNCRAAPANVNGSGSPVRARKGPGCGRSADAPGDVAFPLHDEVTRAFFVQRVGSEGPRCLGPCYRPTSKSRIAHKPIPPEVAMLAAALLAELG